MIFCEAAIEESNFADIANAIIADLNARRIYIVHSRSKRCDRHITFYYLLADLALSARRPTIAIESEQIRSR
jgi:hypothetical protein